MMMKVSDFTITVLCASIVIIQFWTDRWTFHSSNASFIDASFLNAPSISKKDPRAYSLASSAFSILVG